MKSYGTFLSVAPSCPKKLAVQIRATMVRSRGLEPPRVAPLAPQASASTNSATTACGLDARPSGRATADVTVQPKTDKLPPALSGGVGGARQKLLDLNGDAVAADHHGAAGNRQVVGEDADLVILGSIELDNGAAAEPQHLVNWHGGGAQNHRNVDRNVVEFRHGPSVPIFPCISWRQGPHGGENRRVSFHHGMVTRWLTRAISCGSGSLLRLGYHRSSGASAT